MAELDSRVNISVTIADTTATRAGFGVMAILHKHKKGTSRVLTFNDFDGLKADFPINTPVGRYGEIFFSQAFTAEKVKVLEVVGAETYTAALDAAAAIDNDWYMIGTPSHVQANQELTAAYALSNKKQAVNVTDDAVAIDTGTTDLGSVLKAHANNRASTYYSGKAGEELTVTSIAVSGTTATCTHTAASIGLAIGDKVGAWGSTSNSYSLSASNPGSGSNTQGTVNR